MSPMLDLVEIQPIGRGETMALKGLWGKPPLRLLPSAGR